MEKKHPPSTKPVLLIWNWVIKEKKNIQFIVVYAIVAGLLSLVIPLAIQALVGTIMAGKLSSSWVIIVALTTVFVALSGTTKLAKISIMDSIQKKLFVRYAWIYKEAVLENKDEVNQLLMGEKARKFLDIVTLQKSFSKLISDFSESALQIIVGIILLTVYHPIFIFVGLAIVSVILIGFKFTWSSGFESARNESTMKFETYESILKLSNDDIQEEMETIHMENFNTSVDSYVRYRTEHFQVLYRQAKFGIFAKTILTATMLVIGSYLLVNNQISLGQFLAAEILIITLLEATEKLILSVENMYDCGIALEKLNGIDPSKPLNI